MPRDNGSQSKSSSRGNLKQRLRLPLLLLGPLLVIVVAVYFYLTSGRYVSTDDAYVRYDKVQISSDVAGRVTQVAVVENERVKQGQLLFALDDEPYRIALMRTEGVLVAARNDIEAMRASYRQKEAQLKAAQASAEYMQREYERQKRLATQNITSEAKVDDARRNYEVARQQVTAMQQDLAQVLANLGGDVNLPVDRHPRVLQALAARDQAALDLSHTRILAPADGIIANLDPRPGQYVTVGMPMCSLVETDRLYIEANLKETELTHVRPGNEATVAVDAYPDRIWHAKVTSVGAGTGSEFSILPPQNATGNWVKIVQRVPVRLHIESTDDLSGLRAGMSVTVEIDTRHKTPIAAALSASDAAR